MSDFAQQYRDVKPKFNRLKESIVGVLQQLIEGQKIPLFAIESRVKDEVSFLDKIVRKGYVSPLDDIDDVCGVRIICYYQEDIGRLCEIIDKELNVLKKEDKRDQLEDNQFGYTSYHYVVSLKDGWMEYPSVRGLQGLKVEIQIRTMLMHTWSAISHKLLYKRESDVPPQFKRQLNRLSALIELADEQFDAIKNVKMIYKEELAEIQGAFDYSVELSSDSLVALHQRYFENRTFSDDSISDLLGEIMLAGFNLKQLVENIELCLPYMPELEAAEAEGAFDSMELPMWNFTGAIRTILDLCSESYFKRRSDTLPHDVLELREKYRSIIFSS